MKRLNVKLLIWMIVIGGVSLGAIMGLHQFQVQRTSGSYLKLAEQSEAEKDYGEAVSFYSQYLVYHPSDAKVQAKFALLMTDLAEQPEGGRMALSAMGALQKALQLDEANTKVRGRMARFLARFRRIDDADAQLQILKKQEPENPEWDKMLADCRIFAGKYPEAIELLQSALKQDSHDVTTYRQLALIQRQHLDDKEAMNKTLDEMIAANPDNGAAWLTRFQFYNQEEKKDEAKAALAKALELAPEDINILLTAAQMAELAEEYDAAAKYMETAVAKHPEEVRPYLALARLERRQNKTDAAIAHIERGLKSLPKNAELTMALWEMKLADNDVPGAYLMLEEMSKLGIRPEFLERCRAQTQLADGKTLQALHTLNNVRPRIAAPELLIPVDLLRAQCYELLGQSDLQIEAYRQALFNDQTNRIARLGLAMALSRSGQTGEAVEELNSVASGGDVAAAVSLLQVLMGQQLRLAADQRDWSRCEQLINQLVEQLPDNQQLKNIRIELLAHKGDYAAAHAELAKVQEANPKDVGPWIARIDITSQEKGVEAANEELAAARAALGDLPALRSVEVNLLLRQGNEEAKKKLDELAAGIDKLPAAEQKGTRQMLASALSLFGDREQAFNLYEQVIKDSPDDLVTRISAFRVARDAGDDEKMQKSIDQIKDLVGDTNSNWQYAEAARIVSAVGRNKLPITELEKARKLIDSALAQRPNWGPLHALLGEIEQRQGNIDMAILKYERAFELGEQNAQTIRSLVMLMVLRNRPQDAERIVNSIPQARVMLGPRVSATIDIMLGREKEALVSAQQAAESDQGKSDYSTQLWYGNVMLRAGKFDDALKAIIRARDLADNVPDTWLALINFYVATHDMDKAKEVIAQAESKLPADRKDRTMALAYELVKDYPKAGPLYESALKQTPKDLNLLRQMATYYSQVNDPQRLVDILSQTLSTAGEAGTQGEPHARWARRTLTQLLAVSRNPAEVRKALDFLNKTLPGIKLDLDDQAVKANLLSMLTDEESRNESVALLTEVVAQDPSRWQDQVNLARLFNRSGDWTSAKGAMLTVLKQRPDDPQLMLLFAEMLLQHDEQTDADQWLRKYEQSGAPKTPVYIALNARRLAQQDQPEQAIAMAKSVITPPLSPDQIPLLKNVAAMLEEFASTASNPEPYYEAAGGLYREYVKEVPDDTLVLAKFVGEHGDLTEGLDLCEAALKKGNAEPPLRTALQIARARPTEITDEHKQRIQEWFDTALKATPDDVMLGVLLADFYDLQERFVDSEKIYRGLLKNKNLAGALRATVLNNLAYLLAMQDKKGEEAWPLIEEAVQIVGPVSELLDTRGMVQLARGNAPQAVQDMKRAVGNTPSPIKLYHLAYTHRVAGEGDAAAAAFKQAVELGLKESDVPALERKYYQAMLAEYGDKPAAAE